MIKFYEGGDKLFTTACNLAEVKATHRQWRKWNQKRGAAYAKKDEAQRQQQPSEKSA